MDLRALDPKRQAHTPSAWLGKISTTNSLVGQEARATDTPHSASTWPSTCGHACQTWQSAVERVSFDWHSKTATAVLLLSICSAGYNTVDCPPGGRRGRQRQRNAGPRAAPPPAPPPRSRPGAARGAARRCTRSAVGASAARRQRRRRGRRAPSAAARAHLCPASARGLSSHGLAKCTKQSQGAVERSMERYVQLFACLRGRARTERMRVRLRPASALLK